MTVGLANFLTQPATNTHRRVSDLSCRSPSLKACNHNNVFLFSIHAECIYAACRQVCLCVYAYVCFCVCVLTGKAVKDETDKTVRDEPNKSASAGVRGREANAGQRAVKVTQLKAVKSSLGRSKRGVEGEGKAAVVLFWGLIRAHSACQVLGQLCMCQAALAV